MLNGLTADATLDTLFDRQLASRDARKLLLAVSGGPDSMALLHLADLWRRRTHVAVAVATVDHGLRAGSRAEAAAVAAESTARGLDHTILTWTGAKPGTGLPAAARAARYRLLAAHARNIAAGTIVTAHHADDQAETVLMRLLRGSGPAGLAGMAALAPVPGEAGDDLRLFRPLLAVPKADLVVLCRALALPCFEDPSNADETWRRPQIRRLAAVLAAEGFGRAEILRLSRRAARAEQALASLLAERLAALPARRAPDLFEAPAAAIAALPAEALVRLLSAEIARLSGATAPRLERVEYLAARLRAGAPCGATLGGIAVRLDAARLRLTPAPPRQTADATSP